MMEPAKHRRPLFLLRLSILLLAVGISGAGVDLASAATVAEEAATVAEEAATVAEAADSGATAMARVVTGAGHKMLQRDIVAFGDSISIGFREPGVDCDDLSTAAGYPEHLEELLQPLTEETVRLLPRGLCGEKTGQALTRFRNVLADDRPDAVIVMEGTNDVSAGNPSIGNETIKKNLGFLTVEADLVGVSTVLSTIIPFGPGIGSSGQNRNNERVGRLTTLLAGVAANEGRPFADPFNDLLAVPGVFQQLYDPDGYHLNAAGNEILASSFVEPTLEALSLICEPGPCVEDGTTLCLQDSNFAVRSHWFANDDEDDGQALPQSADTGKFWFFSPDNIELVVKVLDGRCINDHYWVFYGSLSDVQYRIEVTDTETCSRRLFLNPDGTFASQGETFAFPAPRPDSCPSP